MSKVTTNEFIRTEILSALSEIKPKYEMMTVSEFVSRVTGIIKISSDQPYRLLIDKKSREEMKILFSKYYVYTNIGWAELFESKEIKNYLMICIRRIIFNAYKELFTNESDYPKNINAMSVRITEKEINQLKEYFSKSNF